MNSEPLGARNLDEHAAAIGNGGGDRIGDQEVQMMQRPRPHFERRQLPHAFGLVETRGQELDKEIAARLTPAPGLGALQPRRGLERKILQDRWQRRRGRIVERERQALETGDVDIVGLGGLIEFVTQAEFAFVEAEGLRADDRAAEAEHAGLGEGVEQRASRRVDAQKAFGAQDADHSRARGLCLRAAGGELAVAGEAGANFIGILADIGLAHVRADAERVVPIDLVVALDAGRRPSQIGDSLVFQRGEQVGVGGVGDRGMAADHV